MSPATSGQRGQALTEYALCAVVLAVALLVPWDGQECVAAQLAHAVRGFLRGVSFLLSIV